MRQFSINYDELSNSVDKKYYKLADVKHKLQKVGFDIVKFKDGNPDELWQIQDADDGSYIVAKYETEENLLPVVASKWDVLINESSINIFYKGHPITKLATNQFAFNANDLESVKAYLPKKLATDGNFVKALLSGLDGSAKENIMKLYPELF